MDNATYLSLSGRDALNAMVIAALGNDSARIALLNDWTTFAINPAALTVTYTSQALSTSSLVGQYVGSMVFNYKTRDLGKLVPYPLAYRDPYPTTFVKLQAYFKNRYGIQLDDGELTRADGQVLTGTTAIDTVPDPITGAVTLTANASSSRFTPASALKILPIHPSVPVTMARLFTLDGNLWVGSLADSFAN